MAKLFIDKQPKCTAKCCEIARECNQLLQQGRYFPHSSPLPAQQFHRLDTPMPMVTKHFDH